MALLNQIGNIDKESIEAKAITSKVVDKLITLINSTNFDGISKESLPGCEALDNLVCMVIPNLKSMTCSINADLLNDLLED